MFEQSPTHLNPSPQKPRTPIFRCTRLIHLFLEFAVFILRQARSKLERQGSHVERMTLNDTTDKEAENPRYPSVSFLILSIDHHKKLSLDFIQCPNYYSTDK